MPFERRAATSRLRRITWVKSSCGCAIVIPNSSNVRRFCQTSAFLSKALVGIQPQFRHIPPSSAFSTNATFIPSWAARIAATYPPGPDPMTIKSKLSMVIPYYFFSNAFFREAISLAKFSSPPGVSRIIGKFPKRSSFIKR